jgi:hypothetical protein
MRVRCYTLFDITQTNVNSRRKGLETDACPVNVDKQRSQQSNLETILQVASMRSQPEQHSTPTVSEIKMSEESPWGYSYLRQKITKVKIWSFDFEISHTSVFNNGIEELGNLNQDCSGVPMIVNLDESLKLSGQLDISDGGRNIYFEVVND